jgi:hypothetical protein
MSSAKYYLILHMVWGAGCDIIVGKGNGVNSCNVPVKIILADDDPDDQLLVQAAFDENCSCIDLHIVNDGNELLN